MLEMVARADLPPPPNADGTYPVPDANNPFAEPQFPFGNPPYAARAYSYVSVAQFDALKSAWHFKYLYNRPSPSDVDGGVRALLPTNGLPSYPSEDAVLSGVTAELLKLLFPTNVEEINRKAAEQREAALLSGRAAASDLAAGLALGNAVAALFAPAPPPTACAPRAARRRCSRPSPRRRPRAARSRGAASSPTASAHAGRVRQRPGVDDDPGGRPNRAAAGAAFDVLGADGARGRGGSQRRPQPTREQRPSSTSGPMA